VSVRFRVPNTVDGRQDTPLLVQAHLSPSYPFKDPPVLELSAEWLAEERVEGIIASLIDLYTQKRSNNGVGEVVLFECVEWLRENVVPPPLHRVDHGESEHLAQLLQKQELSDLKSTDSSSSCTDERSEREPSKRNLADSDMTSLSLLEQERAALGIVSGDAFVDRKSTFQAHVAPVSNTAQVKLVMNVLLSDRKIARATHNIMAYRIVDDKRGVTISDNDEDGEEAAGGRLSHLLEVTNARNVIVVVSRWFGGILLGPDRFKHINNTARILLEAQGFNRATVNTGNNSKSKGRKR